MTDSHPGDREKRRNNLPQSSLVFRMDGYAIGQTSPRVAALLSVLSWPEPECPKALKPLMIMVAVSIWLTLAALAAELGPTAGFWPILPIGAIFLVASFVGGSLIAVFTAALFFLSLYLGYIQLQLPDVTRELITAGYRAKDFVMILVFTWFCGVPHWRRRFSWRFTLLWGLGVVFAPVIYIIIELYGFYGHLPQSAIIRYLNREFLMAWGVTVIVAALAAKILYLVKDFLRRVFS